jgi:hypothetical protein
VTAAVLHMTLIRIKRNTVCRIFRTIHRNHPSELLSPGNRAEELPHKKILRGGDNQLASTAPVPEGGRERS